MNRHERRRQGSERRATVRLAFREWQVVMRKQGRPTSPDAFAQYVKDGMASVEEYEAPE